MSWIGNLPSPAIETEPAALVADRRKRNRSPMAGNGRSEPYALVVGDKAMSARNAANDRNIDQHRIPHRSNRS